MLEVSKAFLLSDEVLIIVDLVRKGKEALLVFRQGREEGQKWSQVLQEDDFKFLLPKR